MGKARSAAASIPHRRRDSTIERMIEEFRQEFRQEENLAFYEAEDLRVAERKYIAFRLGRNLSALDS